MKKTKSAIASYLERGYSVTTKPIEVNGKPSLVVFDSTGNAEKAWSFSTEEAAEAVVVSLEPPVIKKKSKKKIGGPSRT